MFLLPQKQTCFTPDGRKVIEKVKCSKSKVGCALFRFYFTLIYRNAIKSKQEPGAKFRGKIWGRLVTLLNFRSYILTFHFLQSFPKKLHILTNLPIQNLGVVLCGA